MFHNSYFAKQTFDHGSIQAPCQVLYRTDTYDTNRNRFVSAKSPLEIRVKWTRNIRHFFIPENGVDGVSCNHAVHRNVAQYCILSKFTNIVIRFGLYLRYLRGCSHEQNFATQSTRDFFRAQQVQILHCVLRFDIQYMWISFRFFNFDNWGRPTHIKNLSKQYTA